MPDWLSERNAIDGYDPYYQHLGSVIAENFGRGLTESFDRERDSRHYDDLLSSISPQYSAMDPVARRRLSTSMATVAKQGGFGVNNLLQGMQQARQQKQFEQDLPMLAQQEMQESAALGNPIGIEQATAIARQKANAKGGYFGSTALQDLAYQRRMQGNKFSEQADAVRPIADARIGEMGARQGAAEAKANQTNALTPVQVEKAQADAAKSNAIANQVTTLTDPKADLFRAKAELDRLTGNNQQSQIDDRTATLPFRTGVMRTTANKNQAQADSIHAQSSPFMPPNDKAKMSNLRTTISAIQKQISNVTNELYFAPNEEAKANARARLDVLKKQLDGYVEQMKKVTDAQPTLPPFINGIAGPVATPATFDKPIILQQGAPLFGDSTGQALPPSPPVGSLNTMPTVPTQPTASTNADPVQIASDEEFDALPSGTLFTDPSGKVRRKP